MSDVSPLADALAQEVQDMAAESRRFEERVNKTQADFSDIYKQAVQGLATKKLPPELDQLVAILQAQPRLIDPVMKFIQGKVSEIDAAVAKILGEEEEEEEEEEEKEKTE